MPLDVNVPGLIAEPTGWCLPALPYAGDRGPRAVPPVGATCGSSGRTGTWASRPSGRGMVHLGQRRTRGRPGHDPARHPGRHKIEISDDTNAITLTASGGASITIGPDGIMLDNGQGAKIELSGATVSSTTSRCR